MIKIFNNKFDVYQYKLIYQDKFLRGDKGVYMILNEKFYPVYIGMTIVCIKERIVTHRRNGIIGKYLLVFILDFSKRYLHNYILDCYLTNSIYNKSRIIQKKWLLRIESKLIKFYKPKYNTKHCR